MLRRLTVAVLIGLALSTLLFFALNFAGREIAAVESPNMPHFAQISVHGKPVSHPNGPASAAPARGGVDPASPLQAFERQVRMAYRLPVDARFRRALAEIVSFANPGEPLPEIAFKTNERTSGWVVFVGAEQLGVLSEVPTLREFRSLAEQWCFRHRQELEARFSDRNPLLEFPPRENAIEPVELWRVVLREGARLQERQVSLQSVEHLHRALTRLELQKLDRLGWSDALGAKALAYSIIADVAAGGTPGMTPEQALLAFALGYGEEAAQGHAVYEPWDPFGPFLAGNRHALTALVRDSPSSGWNLSRYFSLRLSAAHGDSRE